METKNLPQWVANLRPGDSVYWIDPDGDKKHLKIIGAIEICEDIIKITDIDGSYLECFAHELE